MLNSIYNDGFLHKMSDKLVSMFGVRKAVRKHTSLKVDQYTF